MRGTAPNEELLAQAREHCARITAAKSRSFTFAARFLPADRRADVHALYAFCRTVDDIADLPQAGASSAAIRTQLDGWRAWLGAGAPFREDPVSYALAHAVRRHNLPLDPLLDLLGGLHEDIVPRHLPDMPALERYCYCVAGTVGIVMAVLLGARDARALAPARDLGIAMQLTNVLRDVGEDLTRGRIYLPASAMAEWGYRREDLERGAIDGRFIALMRELIEAARALYAQGMAGLRYLPGESQFPIALAAHIYAAILGRIEEAGYDVFSMRARTGRRHKIALAARLGINRAAARLFAVPEAEQHAVSYIGSAGAALTGESAGPASLAGRNLPR